VFESVRNIRAFCPHKKQGGSTMNLDEYFAQISKSSSDILQRFGFAQDKSREKQRIQVQKIINVQLMKEMEAITKLLNEKAIPHVFLKGPILGNILYAHYGLSPAKRQTSDIDILIPIRSMPEAFDVLGKYGYCFGKKTIDRNTCLNYIRSNQNGVFHM